MLCTVDRQGYRNALHVRLIKSCHSQQCTQSDLYGIETWVMNKQQVSKNRMMDSERNVEIRVKLKQEGVLEKGKRSQVRQRKALKEMV